VDEQFELWSVPASGGAVLRLNVPLGNQRDVVDYAVSPGGGDPRRLNGPLPSGGNISAFSIGNDGERVFYRGDQLTKGVEELFAIRLDSDADADGVPAGCDCDSGLAEVWSLPGEVRELVLVQAEGSTTLSWTAPTVPGAVTLLCDTLRADRPGGFLPGSGATVVEIESGGADTSSSDGDDPPHAYYYVVRGTNACGDGTVGCERDPVGPCP
jgi:hypothetical protein